MVVLVAFSVVTNVEKALNDTDTDVRLLIVSAGAIVIFSAFVLYCMMSRLEYSPFRQRFVPLIIVSGVCNVLVFAESLVRVNWTSFDSTHCLELSWFANLTYCGVVCPYFIRAYRLYCIFNVRTQNASQALHASMIDHLTKQISQRRIWIYFFVSVATYLVVCGIFQFSKVGFVSERVCDPEADANLHSMHLFWIVLDLITVAVSGLFVHLLRNVWDDFSIAEELISVSCVFFVAFVAHIISMFVRKTPQDAFINVLMVLRSVLLYHVTWIRPLIKSYGIDSIPILRPVHYAETLTGVLNYGEFYDLFAKYMDVECDPDKVLFNFYIDTHLFKLERDMSDAKRREEAWRIWNYYLSFPPMHPRYNILRYQRISRYEEPIKQILQDENHHVNESLFEPLNHHVFTLLEDGAFRRFLESSQGAQMRRQVSETQRIQDMLLGTKMLGRPRGLIRDSSGDEDDERRPLISTADPPLTYVE
eukprot:TRINITY_DN1424_c0_g1_i1.p1 TRINITY_DN1424_c0_g1~~TRINITY_DN1424_c0_g1_i1.p1  ORF type:complete len:476 (-),score=69.93 TRINITY_DN1424_c0_g1_i1:3372-4799(-)